MALAPDGGCQHLSHRGGRKKHQGHGTNAEQGDGHPDAKGEQRQQRAKQGQHDERVGHGLFHPGVFKDGFSGAKGRPEQVNKCHRQDKQSTGHRKLGHPDGNGYDAEREVTKLIGFHIQAHHEKGGKAGDKSPERQACQFRKQAGHRAEGLNEQGHANVPAPGQRVGQRQKRCRGEKKSGKIGVRGDGITIGGAKNLGNQIEGHLSRNDDADESDESGGNNTAERINRVEKFSHGSPAASKNEKFSGRS